MITWLIMSGSVQLSLQEIVTPIPAFSIPEPTRIWSGLCITNFSKWNLFTTWGQGICDTAWHPDNYHVTASATYSVVNTVVTFINSSTNATTYFWNFGMAQPVYWLTRCIPLLPGAMWLPWQPATDVIQSQSTSIFPGFRWTACMVLFPTKTM